MALDRRGSRAIPGAPMSTAVPTGDMPPPGQWPPPDPRAHARPAQAADDRRGVRRIVAAAAAFMLWSRAPDYKVLYTNVSDRDGGAIIASLQQMNVPYKFAEAAARS
jgi:flagellar M-ring protein FliF